MPLPRSLIHRLYLLIALAVTPALAVLGVREWQTFRADQARMHELALSQAQLIARENALLFQTIRQTLGVLAATSDTQSTERCNHFFKDIPSLHPLKFAYWVARPDGKVVCHTMGKEIPGLTLADRPYFQEALQTRDLTLGGLMTGRVTNRPLLPFAMPFTDSSGRVVRVVGGAINLENLVAYLDKHPLTQGGRLTVADRNGVIIYRSNHDELLGKPLPPALHTASLGGLPGTLEFRDGTQEKRIAGYVPSAVIGVPLFHAVSLDVDAQLMPARQAAAIGIALLLLSVAVAVVAASIGVGAFIRRPVGQLIEAAGRWSHGDFSVRVPVEGEDEVSRMAVTFNRMAQGLSERAALERTAREAQMMFADVVAILPVGIWLADRMGNITHANARAREIWCMDENQSALNIRDLRGRRRDTGEAVPPEQSAAVRALMGETCLGEELDILCFDGTTHKIILNAALPIRNEAGVVRMVVIVNEDLTEVYAARREAEEANLAKSKFLAAASHDLRQPVQSLVMFNAVLSQRLAGHPAEAVVKHMGASLEALQRLLSDLLEVSRLDAGSVQPHPVPFKLETLIDRLYHEYVPQARAQGIRLRRVPTQAWTVSDPLLLERIVRNLLENALRYTQRGTVLLGVRRHGGHLRLCVVDTGIGIAPDQQALIFQEFYQVDNPGRNRDKGLGLGLAIVSRLCALLAHRIEVSSAPGHGSCFSVELPMHAAPVEAPDSQRKTTPFKPLVATGRVLVIDDEAIVREGLTACLEAWGVEVSAAADADEALAICSTEGIQPALIISDYRLAAHRSGVEAVQRLRAACGMNTPAIILTGDTDPARITEIRRSGFLLLYKPVDPERLRSVVSGILSQNSSSRPDLRRGRS